MKSASKLKRIVTILAFISYPLLNISQKKGSNKIVFAAEPFSKDPKEQKEFKWDRSIYAKMKLQKALKNYAQKFGEYELDKYKITGVYKSYLKFICMPIEDNENRRSNNEITL